MKLHRREKRLSAVLQLKKEEGVDIVTKIRRVQEDNKKNRQDKKLRRKTEERERRRKRRAPAAENVVHLDTATELAVSKN